MYNATVTGATSFIGAALVRRLLKDGIDCYAIVRPGSKNTSVLPMRSERLHVITADAAKPKQWENQIPACDVFYHFAWEGVGAQGRADAALQQQNVKMSLDCLDTAARIGIKRFVFAGSQAEYGICDTHIYENTPCHPETEYGKGKLQFFQEAIQRSAANGIELAHLRIFSVYGPGDHPWTLVSKCLRGFRSEISVPLTTCTQLWNYIYITDIAKIIRLFGDCDLKNETIFNVAGEHTAPLKQFVDTMWNICGKHGKPEYNAMENIAEKTHGIDPDINRMKSVIDWKQSISFEQGIRLILNEIGE